jgi:hypothetical protein
MNSDSIHLFALHYVHAMTEDYPKKPSEGTKLFVCPEPESPQLALRGFKGTPGSRNISRSGDNTREFLLIR